MALPSKTRLIVQLAVFALIFIDAGQSGQTTSPVELMTDITNHLGFKVLYYHSFGNRNNIGLSPCGLASVLVALFEGSDGQSAIEIHKVMELPFDRDVIRIGYRDIHRRLRSYFYNQENLLSGLSLSKENITIRPEYETILRFYGYDLENGGMVPSGTKNKGSEEVEEKMETTAAPEEETTTVHCETDPPTTEIPTTTELETTTEAVTETTTTTTTKKTTTTTEVTEEPTTTEPRTTMYIFTFKPIRETTILPEETTTELPETTTEEISTTISPEENTLIKRRRRKQRTFLRSKRSPIQYVIATDEESSGHFNYNPGTPNPQFQISDYVISDKYQLKGSSLNNEYQHEDVISHVFYLNRLETVNVPYKVFNSIMRYNYLNSIQSSVLEVELDNSNYNMLIILPDYEFGLEKLITTMKSHYAPTIRDIRRSMQSKWVKAIVPKFFLKGHVILTGDLQNMGVLDIFEPYRADFTPMTEELGIYTRHVEQAINVNIRTHANDHINRRSTYHKTPVELSVNHPFLFCIVDTEMDLVILTGRILNPLNSRIQ